MTDLRVLTWNVNLFTAGRIDDKAALLARLDWDVALLQEVEQPSFQRLVERFPEASAAYGCAVAPTGKRPNGAVVLARSGWTIETSGVVPWDGTWDVEGPEDARPQSDRAVWAVLRCGDQRVTVASFHAPNAARRNEDERRWAVCRKLRAYAALDAWLRSVDGPVVVGMDANAWVDSAADCFADPPTWDQLDDQAAIMRFLLDGDAEHGLRDGYRAWLRARPDELERLRVERPNGPLAVTYVRGGNRPVADRFDVLMASRQVEVLDVVHRYEDALVAGSDHAIVQATLTVPGR